MQVHYGIDKLPSFKHPIVTIGTFDGVHAGHRTIIQRIISLAKEKGGEAILITFEPHPRFLLQPKHDLKLLNTMAEKKELLHSLGLQHLVIAPFTLAFAQQSPKAYVEEFLLRYFAPEVLVIGYDHHFGKERAGNFEFLNKYAQAGTFELEEISKQLVDASHVSSTAIRKALASGEVATANTLLQSSFSLEGKVIRGAQNGRKIGFPTANISLESSHKLIPAHGVYAVKAHVQDQAYKGIMNIGHRPTIDNNLALSLEVHILDFDQDIYDKNIKIEFLKHLRREEKFNSLDELKDQIKKDEEKARAFFNH